MEAALESFRNISDLNVVIPALNLMKVYFDNIAKEPSNPKYRKIRVENAKFNSIIWQLEEARTFLFLAGFEEDGEFIVLPDHINVDKAKHLIDTYASAGSLHNPVEINSRTSHETSPKTLKLNTPKGSSYFDQNIKADLTLLSYMIEMGFDEKASEKALIATKNVGVQPAMDWISMNPQVLIPEERTKDAVSNHSNQASQGQDLACPITGISTAQDSRPAPISRYQKTADERHKFQEKLRLEAIDAARTEKLAKQQHKQYLLKEMQHEKEEKKEKEDQAKKLKTSAQSSDGLCSTEVTGSRDSAAIAGMSGLSQDKKTELRIRLPNGQVTNISFSNDAQIREIYKHVCRLTEMAENDFVVMTTYPQAELKDMELTLEVAELTPRAALVVQRRDQHGKLIEGHGEVCIVKTILSMDDWQAILKKATDKLLVAQFYTSWCANSRAIADKFESLNADYGTNQGVIFARVDIEQLKVLKYQLRISTLPTFKLYWNEQEVAEQQGNDMDSLEELIKTKQQGPDETETMMEEESGPPDE